jgi:hypothetical protein
MNKIKVYIDKHPVLSGLILALLIEGVTVFLRFVLGLQSKRTTSGLAEFTFGYRIHHGYIGIILLLISLAISNRFVKNLFICLGLGNLISDAIHHFIVLWFITGSPDFDLKYPNY